MKPAEQGQATSTVKTPMHPVVADKQDLRESGKEAGLVNAPIVSVNPQTEATPASNPSKKSFKLVDSAIDSLIEDSDKYEYDYKGLKPGQGVFISKPEGSTIDSLMANARKTVHNLNEQYSERETDKNGDTILDMVTIEIKKRNEDGTIQLDNGVPRVGANSGHIPRLVSYRKFIARPITKGEEIGFSKAEHDGVLIVRVY